ncbi:hypothetical protein C1Y63_09940 [Corynebacterium sp. 13CS0277]|uniref:transposase n=1 Tax=Corynebacterium sp. 13CS0277 TaxID=2071994 RepID=UPI000D044581|nr:transposase [Corynebacterium sp. 13CS0277]PRQ10693.1 hypothetical protein C1Y63_09940 [Corynebacterium sp. 13CS0277]
MSTSHPRFTDDPRRDVASKVIDAGMTYGDAATTAGVSINTVRAWVSKERTRRKNTSPSTRDVAALEAENRRLRAENLRMKKEAEFLEKAAAFFANHPGT